MATSPPFAPWVHHKNSSATSLSRLGLEVAIPPGQTIPTLAPADDYLRKELPLIPKNSGKHNRQRPLSDQSAGISSPKGKNTFRSQYNNRIDSGSRPAMGSKSHSLPESVSRLPHPHRQTSADSSNRVLPPPPPPPMTKSAQKILQLTGFDPSFDQDPQSHYSVSLESSDSSGSQYSQPESEIQDYGAVPASHWDSTFMGPVRGEPSTAYLQSSVYSVSQKSASVSELSVAAIALATTSTSTLRTRDWQLKDGARKMLDPGTEISMGDMTSEEFMAIERVRYEKQKRPRLGEGVEMDVGTRFAHEFTDAARSDLVPLPLTIRKKEKGKARMHAGNEKLDRRYTTAASPMGIPYDGMRVSSTMQPPPRPTAKRSFGSGKHPLKSPFPFGSNPKESESVEPEQNFRKKISGALKRLSGGKQPPAKQTIISNAQREPNGPDTPMPSAFATFGFPGMLQKGNEHFQGAVGKAKKGLKIKTADEKRREDLKKQIVVVGVTDQSPDGRVSEWL